MWKRRAAVVIACEPELNDTVSKVPPQTPVWPALPSPELFTKLRLLGWLEQPK